MQTRSSSRLSSDQISNPTSSTNLNLKGRNCRRSKQQIENSNLEEHSHAVVTMADQCTMAELLRAPIEGYAEAIVVPLILADQFELKHSLINMMTTNQFFGLEKDNPHDHIRTARRWLKKEILHLIHTWEELVSKFINEFFPPSRTTNLRNKISNFQQRFDESFHEAWDRYKDLLRVCPHHGFIELHQLDTFYNALNPADQDSLNAAAGGNLLERINQQTSVATTAMTAMLKQFQATLPPAPVKAVEETCVTYGGAHPYYQCLTAGGNTFPELRDNIQEKVRRMNEANMKAMQAQIDMVKNELRNKMKSSIQTSLSNQINEIINMMASFLQMNTASASGLGSLPSNTVANPKGELKAITTRSGLVIDGPTISTPSRSINPEEDEHVEETFTDPNLAEITTKVPPPPAQKYKPPSQQEYVVHRRDPLHPTLLSNKEKLQELANTLLNENCSEVILKKLPEKLGDPGKFLISCGFSELKCKALANLGASINLMPLSIWKKLDVFVSVGKFTFPADFVIVDYESDHRVPFILGRPFLRTARALIDVHGEEMILRDERCNILSDKWLDLDSTKDLYPPLHDNPLSGSTTYFSNQLLEEFVDELPSEYDDNLQFDIESDLKEIEFLLYQDEDSNLKDLIDQKDLANLADIFIDPMPKMFTDEHALDYSSPLIFDEYDDDLEVESDAGNVYDDPFDSKGEKIKESKLLIDELDLPCDFLPLFEYDSFISQDFYRVDALPSTNNEDKIFNPGILIQEKPIEIITRVVQDKKLAISNASLVLEDFDPPFYEPLFFKEVPKSKMLLPFSSENKEKVFKPGIHTSKKVHSYFIPELSHQGYKVFKIKQILKSLMKIFLFDCG
nr:hypothetical protein [Tanacetum cinerariifolium]